MAVSGAHCRQNLAIGIRFIRVSAASLFKKAGIDQKGKNLVFTMRSPFDLFLDLPDRQEWQGQQDLNPRPTVLETVALPTELYPYADNFIAYCPVIYQPLRCEKA